MTKLPMVNIFNQTSLFLSSLRTEKYAYCTHYKLQWYLSFRPFSYSNNSVFDQKIRVKNASEFKQNFSVETLEQKTKKSQVESKCTSCSISQERKEPSGAETHSVDRFLIKIRGRLLFSQIHLQRKEKGKKP